MEAGRGRLEVTVREEHNHPCTVRPVEMEPTPFDINPSRRCGQISSVFELKPKVRKGRNFFQRLLELLNNASSVEVELSFYIILRNINKLLKSEGQKLRRSLNLKQ